MMADKPAMVRLAKSPYVLLPLGVCRIGRTEEAKECWSGLRSDYRLHESMLSQIV